MTLQAFRDILLIADPQASHYTSLQKPNYTIWAEYGKGRLMADNREAEHIDRIQIDRYTKIEFDPLVETISAMLDGAGIVYEYLCDYEQDTGYIHHIWDCEVD